MRQDHLEERMLGQPVRSLQHMLRRLSMEYDFLPRLATDGIFGERTLEAVMLFQRELHPPVTGVVDRGTWNAIREHWLETETRLADPRATRLFPGEGTRVELGDLREFMIVPQAMLQVLSHYLNGIGDDMADGRHSQVSADNVRWLQRASGQRETGVMDRAAWEMLSRLYEVFVVKDLEEAGTAFTGGWG